MNELKYKKNVLCELPNCYAVSTVSIEGNMHYIFATDDAGPCYCVDPKNGICETVWDDPGGTMSVVPLPDREGEFFASQRFMPGFAAINARIVHAKRNTYGKWDVRPWLDLPYVHRFDILSRNGILYLLCCILSGTDKLQADWNSPGCLLAAELPPNYSVPLRFHKIADEMTKNHGYCRSKDEIGDMAYTACDEGVFKVVPPDSKGGTWRVQRLIETHASDVAVCDIDKDGNDELAVIEPFHGTDFILYHECEGRYQPWYRYPGKMSFVHVAWGGTICGENVFIGGCRDLNKELFVLHWKNGEIFTETIESGFGPSNVTVFTHERGASMLVANRESAQAAVFEISSVRNEDEIR